MNKQPFYHDVKFNPILTLEEQEKIKFILSTMFVIKGTIEIYEDQVLWTSTCDISESAKKAFAKEPDLAKKLIGIETDPGDPANLM